MNVPKEGSEGGDTVPTRLQFGNRCLTQDSDVFAHNAWDNVDWDEEMEQQAQESVDKNSAAKLDEEQRLRFTSKAPTYWDSFYNVHDNKFFKDRHWLFTEFPELAPPEESHGAEDPSSSNRFVFEIGCGVGNTILPILKYSTEPGLKVYGGDFSPTAINILQSHAAFDAKRAEVFVLDVTKEDWEVPFPENSIDIIVSIFVLSAIEPKRMPHVFEKCFKYLKPGGVLLFRDYGRFDMAQLRFKPGKCLEDNFYVRGDGTMVYFFTEAELRAMTETAGFVEEQITVDRRLQVNRSRMLKMYRVWIQGKFRKPALGHTEERIKEE